MDSDGMTYTSDGKIYGVPQSQITPTEVVFVCTIILNVTLFRTRASQIQSLMALRR